MNPASRLACFVAALFGVLASLGFIAGWHAASTGPAATSSHGSGSTPIACALVATALVWGWRRVLPARA